MTTISDAILVIDPVDTDSDDYDRESPRPSKVRRIDTPRPQPLPLNEEQMSKLTHLFITKVLKLFLEQFNELMTTVAEGAYTCCFTRSLLENIADYDCLRFFVNIVAKKLQSYYSFPRIKEDMGQVANTSLLFNNYYREFLAEVSKLYRMQPEIKILKGPQIQTTLEIVLHHTSELPRQALDLWTSYFRGQFASKELVKRVVATIESGRVVKLELKKACGCNLASATASSYDSPLLYTEIQEGMEIVRVGNKENFPPELKTEMTIMGVCGHCFDKGLNEACNMFLKTNETSLKLASYIMLHSRTNHI